MSTSVPYPPDPYPSDSLPAPASGHAGRHLRG